MNNYKKNIMIEPWLIIAQAPIAGGNEYYSAYSNGDPLLKEDFPFDEIVNNLWESYNYFVLDSEEYETQEDYNEAYDQAYEYWCGDCSFDSEIMDLEIESPEDYEIIYDER